MQFPVSHPDDGLIDISIQEIVRFLCVVCHLCFYSGILRSVGNSCSTRWRAPRLAAPIGLLLCVHEPCMGDDLLMLFNRTDTSRRLHTVPNPSRRVAC